MIFANYNYKNYHNGNKHLHPDSDWCKMVNLNYKYCKKFNIYKWLVFYFWIFVGRVKFHNLPSEHPYWKKQVLKDMEKTQSRLIEKYNACLKNPDSIKYTFNATTTLEDIRKKINAKRKEIERYRSEI